ncbi:MAG: serine/threonine-protein phosphatase, partial [Verrucomicrobia bacterium]|nr:serine/threonine-protein phosphatase [Cytophagales bacterium]
TLYYHHDRKEAVYLQDKGFALAMLRQKTFTNHIENHQITYKSGDMLLLYTDGIVEAMNPEGEEYGYERLREFFNVNAKASVHQFTNNLLDELHRFCVNKVPADDYTIFLIRFK